MPLPTPIAVTSLAHTGIHHISPAQIFGPTPPYSPNTISLRGNDPKLNETGIVVPKQLIFLDSQDGSDCWVQFPKPKNADKLSVWFGMMENPPCLSNSGKAICRVDLVRLVNAQQVIDPFRPETLVAANIREPFVVPLDANVIAVRFVGKRPGNENCSALCAFDPFFS